MKPWTVCLMLGAAALPAMAAEPAAQALDRLAACAGTADTRQRLACFDREIAPFVKPVAQAPARPPAPAPPSAAPAPAPAPAPASPPPAPAAATLGQEQLAPARRPREAEEDQSLTAKITALRQIGQGTYAVTLDNGQTWRHEDQHLGSYLREGQSVTIRKGTLGTYRLTQDGSSERNWIRVTRVR